MGLDREWALGELEQFIKLTEMRTASSGLVTTRRMLTAGTEAEVTAQAAVVEKILDRVIPDWRESVPDVQNLRNRWYQHREAAQRALAVLVRHDELAEKLGDNAPRLSASHLHPWVWESAKTLWSSGHYRNAVGAAALAINDLTQSKVGRRDVSEVKLFQEAFSLISAAPGKPRLRIWPNDGSPTYTSFHQGATAFAVGLYSAIRNPSSHAVQAELTANEALEQLAAFSVLARWVDAATLEK